MSEKRKDNKGRILKPGESQRQNLTYMYRYTDINHKKQCVYAPTLAELREKEERISIELSRGIASTNAKVTIEELLQKALELKGNIRYRTRQGYESHIRQLAKEPFIQRRATDVKTSEAKLFILQMQDQGYGYWTIHSRFTLLKQAFCIAVEDDIIFKNPFNWKLSNVISVKGNSREALPKEDQDRLLQFIANSGRYSKYLDDVIVLLGTGLRISEFCGLTTDDIDFKNRKLRVNKQLAVRDGHTLLFTETKSAAGDRYIPMSDGVFASLNRMVKKRDGQTIRDPVDGRTDLLILRNNGTPRLPSSYQKIFQHISKAYNECYESNIYVTPHILRHTFCTNMMRAGVDIKSMQYLMGHSSADMTLNVYTHANYADAEKSFLSKCSAM